MGIILQLELRALEKVEAADALRITGYQGFARAVQIDIEGQALAGDGIRGDFFSIGLREEKRNE